MYAKRVFKKSDITDDIRHIEELVRKSSVEINSFDNIYNSTKWKDVVSEKPRIDSLKKINKSRLKLIQTIRFDFNI